MTTPASRVTAEKSEAVGHTAGPWRVERGTTLVWGACNPDDSTTYGMGYPIIECRTSPASQWAATKGPTKDEGEANARLIAAAPKMLEALKQALTHIEVDETTHGRNFAAGNVVRAAIRKAQGRAS